MGRGIWWERKVPSTGMPSTRAGQVQPLGEQKTIMGQRGRSVSPFSRALTWMRWISRIDQSTAAAILWCICSGLPPSTKRGVQPQPLKKSSASSRVMRAKTEGLAIL